MGTVTDSNKGSRTAAQVAASGSRRVIVGITGASGSIYGQRMVQVLLRLGLEVHLVATPAAVSTWGFELNEPLAADRLAQDDERPRLIIHPTDDLFASIASGSYRTCGMVVIPCSVKTLAAIAQGFSDNLLTRAADVCLKERRPLVLVLRETPLSLVHLENMARAVRAGAVVLPASPGFYDHPKTIDDLVDFIVGRALDHLIDGHGIGPRWTGTEGEGSWHAC